MATLEQLIIFFLLIGVGVIARKVGVITPGNTPQLTSLVFNFAMPAIILSGITTEQPHISGKDLSIVLTSAFTTLILLIICSRMLARILRYEREYYGVITVMTTFTNVSMMGIPMIYSLYGSEAMIYITVFLLPYNLLFFSYGYYCMKDQSGNTESLNTIYHEYTVSDTLSARQQAIPLIAASMASSQMDKLNAALNQGLDAGLTINEAKEILIQLYAYTGFPRSLNALNELMKVVETRKQRGIEDIEGKAPIAPIPVGDELRRVGTANQTKISGAPVQGPLFDFAPTINQFLQTHLFGDIFARDNLDWQSRELATVGALAATPGVEAQLLSHTRASLRVGLTAAQLRQLAQVLREHGDNDAATRADEALQKALENK